MLIFVKIKIMENTKEVKDLSAVIYLALMITVFFIAI